MKVICDFHQGFNPNNIEKKRFEVDVDTNSDVDGLKTYITLKFTDLDP